MSDLSDWIEYAVIILSALGLFFAKPHCEDRPSRLATREHDTDELEDMWRRS